MSRTTAENYMMAIALAAMLATACRLDGKDITDHSLSDAKKQAQQEARKDRAAAELCFKTTGYGSAPTWNDRGELVCRRHDGKGKGVKVAVQ